MVDLNNFLRRYLGALLVVVTASILCVAAYLPGLSGPWIFDDYTNIIYNSYLRIENLDSSSLYHAAFSFDSGPLRRPIAMLSFALNYYFSGGLQTTTPFKITNLVIHLFNTLLIFWLTTLIFLSKVPRSNTKYGIASHRNAFLFAACVALLWCIHPIQLTSVLYVVQRMTEFAATFTLLGIISYLHGRRIKGSGEKTKRFLLLIIGPLLFGILGLLSKENAILLPLFIALVELFFFQTSWQRQWSALSISQKRMITGLSVLLTLFLLVVAVLYMLPLYEMRHFTMSERLMTEPRVLFFYLSLLFIPDISRLGHQHDDIAVSSSLLVPWTTLPAIFGVILLIAAGFYLRRRNPILGFALLWFFVGHLIESTIYPLEIAHEHRNYLPSFGFALGLGSVLASRKLMKERKQYVWAGYILIVLTFTVVTFIRATQWSNHNSFYHYEVIHHPNSARSQSGYSSLLYVQKRYAEAEAAVSKAASLAPYEAAHVMDLLLIQAQQGHDLDETLRRDVLHRLANGKLSTTTVLMIDRVQDCLQTTCTSLLPVIEQWLEAILERKVVPDPGYFRYRLGQIKALKGEYGAALNLLQQAYESDRQFLHPLFEQINIFISLGQIKNAEFVLVELKHANLTSRYPRTNEIMRLEAEIAQMKNKEM